MSTPNTATVKAWMKNEIAAYPNQYIDDGGEVNMTALAEAACMEFDAYGPAPRFEAPKWLFYAAFEVAEEYEEEAKA